MKQKRPLLVFAGQSNMMGAATLPPPRQIVYQNSFEYLHKPRRFGKAEGIFKREAFPLGEFSYGDLSTAYGEAADADALSTLADYGKNTFFVAAMSNLLSAEEKTEIPFARFSEADFRPGTGLAPYVVEGLEQAGLCCAFAHISKGAVSIDHYLEGAAADYFDRKVQDFFAESEVRFAEDDTAERVLLWLQGESDADRGQAYYEEALAALWRRARGLGFTKFLIIRIGYWGNRRIVDVMRAAERFAAANENVYILTRVLSYFDHPLLDHAGWFKSPIPDEFCHCRDSMDGYKNNHINDEGCRVLTKYALPNLIRIAWEGREPILETENILPLTEV